MMTKKNRMKVKIMSKSNVKSLNALSVKLGKDSDAVNKVGALKNIYAALSGKESKGITVSDVIDEITTVAEKPTKQEVVWVEGTVSNKVTKVSIPEGVTSIGQNAFNGYTELTSITIPATVTEIKPYAFSACKGLTSITIPDSVTTIGRGTFGSCSGLTKAIISENVTVIEDSLFNRCSNLAEITLPAGITAINEYAFYGCSNLANIYFRGTEEQWNAITKGDSWNNGTGSDVEGGTVITYNYTG